MNSKELSPPIPIYAVVLELPNMQVLSVCREIKVDSGFFDVKYEYEYVSRRKEWKEHLSSAIEIYFY